MGIESPISKRLKEARLEAELSQKQLGISAGIDEFVASSRMNQYETGKHTPDFAILEGIGKVLQVPTAYFYTTNDELAYLIKIYYRLPIKKQKQISQYIKELEA